jgi:DNA-binding GntR family transcriptional regulator
VYDRREADHYFHKTISEASGNSILASTVEPLVRKALIITTVGFRYGRAARSFEEHRDIVLALRGRDEKLAVKRIKSHLRNAMRFNAEIWERQTS